MVAFGNIVNTSLASKRSFFGMNFSTKGIPIDVLSLFLAGEQTRDYAIVLLDEFQRMDGVSEEQIEAGLVVAENTLTGLRNSYGFSFAQIRASELMASDAYRERFEQLQGGVDDDIESLLFNAIPARFHSKPKAQIYPLHEAGVTALMSERGYPVKFGPSNEQKFDAISRELGVSFVPAYVMDAIAFGSQEPEHVVHDLAEHTGNHGRRIFIQDSIGPFINERKPKLECSSPEALRYIVTLASAYREFRGKKCMSPEQIANLQGHDLLGKARAATYQIPQIPKEGIQPMTMPAGVYC